MTKEGVIDKSAKIVRGRPESKESSVVESSEEEELASIKPNVNAE